MRHRRNPVVRLPTVVLPPGSKIYHGTVESFEDRLRPGGYDGVVWFSDVPAIAQIYIPRAGSEIYVSAEAIATPSEDQRIRAIQELVGLRFDYDKVRFDKSGNVQSYSIPDEPPWSETGRAIVHILWKDVVALDQAMKENEAQKKHISTLVSDGKLDRVEERQKLLDLFDASDEIAEALEHAVSRAHAEENGWAKLVEKRLIELGYETFGHKKVGEGRAGFKIPMSYGVPLPAGGAVPGRVFIGTTRRPLVLWAKALGEGDLSNVQYHDIEGFSMAQELGLDGVMIDDFAQSEKWGNVNHLSVGLFDEALANVDFEVVEARYRELEDSPSTVEVPSGHPYFDSLLQEQLGR